MTALETLLRSQEFENIGVNDIARTAGVAVGTVYTHFADKTAFLEALLAEWRDRVETRLQESEAQDTAAALRAMGNLEDAVEALTRAVYEQVQASAHILRAVHTYTRLHPEARADDWQALVIRSFGPIEVLLDVFADDIAISDPDLTGRYLGFVFNSIFIREGLMPQDTLIEATRLQPDQLIGETAHMICAYLKTPES